MNIVEIIPKPELKRGKHFDQFNQIDLLKLENNNVFNFIQKSKIEQSPQSPLFTELDFDPDFDPNWTKRWEEKLQRDQQREINQREINQDNKIIVDYQSNEEYIFHVWHKFNDESIEEDDNELEKQTNKSTVSDIQNDDNNEQREVIITEMEKINEKLKNGSYKKAEKELIERMLLLDIELETLWNTPEKEKADEI